MKPFPENYELISVFEAEPEILDPEVPWCYNQLKFTTKRGSSQISYVICPGYRTVEISWSRNDEQILYLELGNVASLEVLTEGPVESVTAHFDEDGPLLSCVLQLKPTVHVSWGSSTEVS